MFCCGKGSGQVKTNDDLLSAAAGFNREVSKSKVPQRSRHKHRPKSAIDRSKISEGSEISSTTASSDRSRRSEKSQRQDRLVKHVVQVEKRSTPLKRQETAVSSEADYPQAPSLISAPSQTKKADLAKNTPDFTMKISELSRPLRGRQIYQLAREAKSAATPLRDDPSAGSGLPVNGLHGAKNTGMLISELQDSERSDWNEENRSVTTVSVQPRWMEENSSVVAESVKPTWIYGNPSSKGEKDQPPKRTEKEKSEALKKRFPGGTNEAVSPTAGSVRPGWVNGTGSFIAGETRASLSDYMGSPKTESVQYGRQSDDGSVGFEPNWMTGGPTRPICVGDNDYLPWWIGKKNLGPNFHSDHDEKRGFWGLHAGKNDGGEKFKTRKQMAMKSTMKLIPEDSYQAAEYTSNQTTERKESGNGVGREAANFASDPVTTMGGQSGSEDVARPLGKLKGPLQMMAKPSSELKKTPSRFARPCVHCPAVVEKVNYNPPTRDYQPNETSGKEGTNANRIASRGKNTKPDQRGSSFFPVKGIPEVGKKSLKKQSPRQGSTAAGETIRSKASPPADIATTHESKHDDSTQALASRRGMSRSSSLDDGSMISFPAPKAIFSPDRFNPLALTLGWFESVDGSRCGTSVRSFMTNDPWGRSSTSFPSGTSVPGKKNIMLRPQLNKSERQAVAKLKIDRRRVHFGQRPVSDSIKVYKAEIDNQKHAAKVFDITCVLEEFRAELLDTFDTELFALSCLDTLNIAKVYGASVSPSEIIVVSEFVEGGTLRDMLNNNRHRRKYLTVRMRLTIAQDIAAGMKELYAHGMQHRQLSSRSILLTDDWRAKIFGIGLAMTTEILSFVDGSGKNFDEEDDSESLIWAAREVFSSGSFSQKSDVYSFGIVLWEIMQPDGLMPYAGLSPDEVAAEKYNGQGLPAPKNCPAAIVELIESCLSKLPDERPTFENVCQTLAKPAVLPSLEDA